MDAIKEAMIREEDEGEPNKRLDPYRAGQATSRVDLERRIMDPNIPKNEGEWWASREVERLRELVDSECKRAEAAHAMTLRQSLEIEKLGQLTLELNRRLVLAQSVCAYPNCTCTPVGMGLCWSAVPWWKRLAMWLRWREEPLR